MNVLSNDTKVNDLVTLILTFTLKIAFLDFAATVVILFHKHILYVIYVHEYGKSSNKGQDVME